MCCSLQFELYSGTQKRAGITALKPLVSDDVEPLKQWRMCSQAPAINLPTQ